MHEKECMDLKSVDVLAKNEEFIKKRILKRQLEATARKLTITGQKDKAVGKGTFDKYIVINYCSVCSDTYYHDVSESNQLIGYIDCLNVPPDSILGIGCIEFYDRFSHEVTSFQQAVNVLSNPNKPNCLAAPPIFSSSPCDICNGWKYCGSTEMVKTENESGLSKQCEARDMETGHQDKSEDGELHLPTCLPNCIFCQFFEASEPIDSIIIDVVHMLSIPSRDHP